MSEAAGRVPALRRVVKRFAGLPLPEIGVLLASPVHEHRLAGLLILVGQARARYRAARGSRRARAAGPSTADG